MSRKYFFLLFLALKNYFCGKHVVRMTSEQKYTSLVTVSNESLYLTAD